MLDDHGLALLAQDLAFGPHGGEGAQGEQGAEDLITRLVQGLALFGGQQAREVLQAALEAIGQLVDHGGAFVDGTLGPGREGRLGRRDGFVQLGQIGLGALGEGFAGRRIDDVEAARAVDGATIDQHVESLGHGLRFLLRDGPLQAAGRGVSGRPRGV